MRVILATDVIVQPLTGVGQYALALGQGLHENPDIESLSCVDVWGRQEWSQVIKDVQSNATRSWTLGIARSFINTGFGSSWLMAHRQRQMRQRWGVLRSRGAPAALFHAPTVMALPQNSDCNASARVMTVHDMSHLRHPNWHPTQRVKRMQQALDQLTADDWTITVSEFTRQELLNHYPHLEQRCVVIYNGHEATPNLFQAAEGHLEHKGCDDSFALCVSTIEPRKNIDGLLAAYRTLPARVRSEYRLVLVGEQGWNSRETRKGIRRAQAEGWLDYRGYVSEAEKRQLYQTARLVVYPSLYEGFGLPVIEALSYGKRVVAGQHTAIAELCSKWRTEQLARQHGRQPPSPIDLVETIANPEALGAAIAAAIESVDTSEDIAQRLEFAAGFSWRKAVSETIELYKRAF